MNVEEVSAVVVDAAYHLHRDLGPGLLESVYEAVLARMLERRGLQVERQKAVASIRGIYGIIIILSSPAFIILSPLG